MPNRALPRLLVVDDDPGVIASYRLVLLEAPASVANQKLRALERELFGTEEGTAVAPPWRVDFVDQGDTAVAAVISAIANSDPYAAVFIDIRMPPGMDGYDAAQAIREIDRDVHVVFVSGYSDFAEEDLLVIAGPKERMTMLPKPVWPEQLRETALRICAAQMKNRA